VIELQTCVWQRDLRKKNLPTASHRHADNQQTFASEPGAWTPRSVALPCQEIAHIGSWFVASSRTAANASATDSSEWGCSASSTAAFRTATGGGRHPGEAHRDDVRCEFAVPDDGVGRRRARRQLGPARDLPVAAMWGCIGIDPCRTVHGRADFGRRRSAAVPGHRPVLTARAPPNRACGGHRQPSYGVVAPFLPVRGPTVGQALFCGRPRFLLRDARTISSSRRGSGSSGACRHTDRWWLFLRALDGPGALRRRA